MDGVFAYFDEIAEQYDVASSGDEWMAEFARRTVPDATVMVSSIEEFLAGNQRRYDLVVSMGVLEFLADLESVIDRIAGLLLPGGALVCTHEPVIHGHEVQHETTSTIEPPSGPVTTARRHTGAMRDLLADRGLRATTAELFVAYQRGGTTGIIYELLVAVPDHQLA